MKNSKCLMHNDFDRVLAHVKILQSLSKSSSLHSFI